ncbi:low temperature requirement protein A [Cellulomonas alba]|uniref:Low temperature requirement protein A n=1 Tax=Cellulomonas alba TaxID=3053467 RepID=A0ABT7SIH1_9CELL|nr:low temperature requirement protein A [Cellulomonas alba]MDM7855859.1 low temperature requirement protein A [Cellulomonas alba]
MSEPAETEGSAVDDDRAAANVEAGGGASDAPAARLTAEPAPGPERHASWLELFFDLVVVAGIGQLAHLLAVDSTAGGLGLYAVAFTAFWLVWACFTAYSNIVGDAVHTVTMLLGMACLGVMVAAVPEVHGEHARAFAIAYVVGRFVASKPWRAGTVVVDLPVLQASFGVLPWVVSIWVEGDLRYWLWAAGLAFDLLVLVSTTRERFVAETQRRLDRMADSMARRSAERRRRADTRSARSSRRPDAATDPRAATTGVGGAAARADVGPDRGGPGRPRDRGIPGGPPDRGGPRNRELPMTPEVAGADLPHLAERLSLFVLIVLGESLIQMIEGASEATWNRRLAVTALGAFVLITGLWAVAVRRGFAGVALLSAGAIAPRLAWVAHLLTTGALATMAAVVARLVEEPEAPVGDHDRWLIVAAFGVYGLGSALVHVVVAQRAPSRPERRAGRVRALCVGVPVAVAVLLGAVRQEPAAEGLVWTLALAVLAVIVATARAARRIGGVLPPIHD